MSADHILETHRIVLPHYTAVALISKAQDLTPEQRAEVDKWPPHMIDDALASIDTTAILRDAINRYLNIGVNPFAHLDETSPT